MVLAVSSFLEVNLPDATTWAYMGLVLVVMLFFRFAKPLHWRNFDLLLLFVLAVPLLYLRDVQEKRSKEYEWWISERNQTGPRLVGGALAATAPVQPALSFMTATVFVDQLVHQKLSRERLDVRPEKSQHPPRRVPPWFGWRPIWRAYFWLLMASAVLLVRSLIDLGLERREPFHANLTTGGLIWFGAIMLIVMIVKSFFPPWEGVPRQVHQSVTLMYLSQMVSGLPLVPGILALACHTVVVVLLVVTGITIFGNLNAGAAAAILYLLLPYTAALLLEPAQVVPSVFVLLALVCFRWPIISALSLGLGTCIGFFPIILVPAWLGFYFGRGHKRFIITYLAVILILVLALSLTVGLMQAWNHAWELTEWQAWKFAKPGDTPPASPPSKGGEGGEGAEERAHSEGLWNSVSLHIAYRIPLFTIFMALMAFAAFWPHPKNLGQLISWTVVLILGLQFWYADAGGIYILWYLPALILQTLRPTLAEHRPAVIDVENDRVLKFVRWISPWNRKSAQSPPLERKTPTAA
jgi:hypothetical protein